MYITLKITGLPHGQKKSGKNKKNDKSQVKMEVFEKKSRKVRKFFIQNIRLLQIYLIPYI